MQILSNLSQNNKITIIETAIITDWHVKSRKPILKSLTKKKQFFLQKKTLEGYLSDN
jgi:hypothetical protein